MGNERKGFREKAWSCGHGCHRQGRTRSFVHGFHRILIGLVALVFVGLSATIAAANAPAPPAYLWFQFDHAPQAVQLLDCRDLICEKPTLLAQSGTCQGSGCVNTPPILQPPDRFECAQQTCLYRESLFSQQRRYPYFKLVAQFSNQSPEPVKTSLPFISDFRRPIAGYGDRHLLVKTQAEMLVIRRDERMPPSRWQTFTQALGITQISELAVVLVVSLWRRLGTKKILMVLLNVGFINLLTFPVVWFFFSSLQSFQYSTSRVFGAFALIISVIFSIVLVRQKNSTPRSLIRIATIWFFSTPLLLILAGVIAFIVGYGEILPSALGLPSFITLLASELYAVLWEAWLIHRVNQTEFSWRQALLLSVLTNMLSLILGLVFLPTVKSFG